jgi:DNA-binding phage protein
LASSRLPVIRSAIRATDPGNIEALLERRLITLDGGQAPFGPQEVETMSRALSPSFARCYGLARVARVWTISRASVYRSLKKTPPNTITRRPGPVGACSDAELADHIRRQIDASRLHGEGYRKLWARLRFAGVRASPRRVRRVMRENGLLAPHRVLRTEAKLHDGTPDNLWVVQDAEKLLHGLILIGTVRFQILTKYRLGLL